MVMKDRRLYLLLFISVFVLLISSCNRNRTGGNTSEHGTTPTVTPEWTWVSGSDTGDQSGTYGTLGVADGANVPGARYGSVSWTDASGNLWLFGGRGYDSSGAVGRLNDLWNFDGTNWT